MKPLISPDEAHSQIAQNLAELSAVVCPLEKCAGRILRQDIAADRPFPPFNRSMMDGYALRAEEIDSSGEFTISGQLPAGAPTIQIGPSPRHCLEIMTGAMVPDDANCVVPYEMTERLDETHIRLLDVTAHKTGDCIHPTGSDLQSAQLIIKSGSLLGGREIAVAASCGYAQLKVAKIPRIAIVSTGDELVEVGKQPQAHQIRRSNDIAIETTLARQQLHAQTRAHLPDDSMACVLKLKQLIRENRILIISGGISMGQKDYVPGALDTLGLKCHFHGVRQKPGKPMGFWTNDHCAVFTLPGNPSSTINCLHHYVLPALFKAMGQTRAMPRQEVSIDRAVRARDDLDIFLPVKLKEANQVTPQPTQNSGDLIRILESDGYIRLIPNAEKSYPTGASFEFYPWY